MTYLAAISKPPLRSTRLNRRNKLAQGLVLGLPFAEGSGLAANDFSGNGNNGTLAAGVTWVPGPSGGCLDCNGTTGYVNCGAGIDTGTVSFSYACWFATTLSNGTTAYLIAKSLQGGAASRWALGFNDGGTGLQALLIDAGNNGPFFSGYISGLNDGLMHHAVVTQSTVSGQRSLILYVDGGRQVTQGTILSSSPFANSAYDLLIGRYNDSSGGASGNILNFPGLIDGVAIWNRVLSPAEVASLYADSWQMYRPVRRVRFGSGGGADILMPQICM